MAVTTPEKTTGSFYQRLKKWRHKRVKRWGKKLSRVLSLFLSKQSLVADKPVLDMADFSHLNIFTDKWREIHAEVSEILKHREIIPTFQAVSPDQKKIAKDDEWRTFMMFGFGEKLERNCAKAPVTTSLLEKVPNLQTAWFSIIKPGAHIHAHRGVTKGIVFCHLGLIVPKRAQDCYMRVDEEICVWRQGEIFVFDDTSEHEVFNNTDEERVILLFNFDRPMKRPGRILHKIFVALLRLTAYYREPKKNMQAFEEDFDAATKQSNANRKTSGD